MSQQNTITLPDGATRAFDAPPSGGDVAAAIGPGLAKAAIAVRVDGALRDLSEPITADAALSIITKKSDDATVYELIRHDCAHVLAQAVQELFPETQVTIGPPIADGFYYDFAREDAFTPDDFATIEKRMAEIVDGGAAFEREVWPRDDAIGFFQDKGETYKAELIRDLPESEPISVYRQGDWLDLCRGPHMPSVKHVGKAFKLTKVAGAYWRGDHRNAMLQRIYGTAWRDEKELAAYLHRVEEAERRDHRRIGKEMGLFHLQEEAVGSVFWHPPGWTIYRALERYMRAKLERAGYVEVKTPQLVDRTLWETSGHWEKFREHMFVAEVDEGGGGHEDAPAGRRHLALKPMNCPGHVQIFRQGLRSYRDLPLRMAEFGSCHRYEPSGALHGIMRVRAFTQDDGHIFCA
ncbi:MAG: threonine--tRNA ligase, partial [Pseudomonadota bacterium]